jgi:hypothetical protein
MSFLLCNGIPRITSYHIPTTMESSSCARTSYPTHSAVCSRSSFSPHLSTKTLLARSQATLDDRQRTAPKAGTLRRMHIWMTYWVPMQCQKTRPPSLKMMMAQGTQKPRTTTANAQRELWMVLFRNAQQDKITPTHGNRKYMLRSSLAARRGRVTDAIFVST